MPPSPDAADGQRLVARGRRGALGLAVGLGLGAVAPAGAQAPSRAGDADADAVTATVLGFHAALAAGQATAAAELLAPDAVVLEQGELQTRAEYLAHHLAEDIAFAKAVPARRGSTAVSVVGDVAWATSTSVIQGTYQARALNLTGTELMVLSRSPGGWRIRAIHWSSR